MIDKDKADDIAMIKLQYTYQRYCLDSLIVFKM